MAFAIDGILLLKKGVADRTYACEGGRSTSAFMREALAAGERMYGCTPALQLYDLTQDDLIDGIEMTGGAALLQWAAESSVVLTF